MAVQKPASLFKFQLKANSVYVRLSQGVKIVALHLSVRKKCQIRCAPSGTFIIAYVGTFY